MAYFSNGTEGMCFDDECGGCIFGKEPCPIAFVQFEFNYDACNNDIATKILNELVKNDGTCVMKKTFSKQLRTDAHQTKLDL